MSLRNLFAVSYEEQHSLPTHRSASSSRAVESTKQRSLPSSSLFSCLSSLSSCPLLSRTVSFSLGHNRAIFPLHLRTQRRSVYSCGTP